MKTREQFLQLADAYRSEVSSRTWLGLPMMVLALLASFGLAGVTGSLLGSHSPLIGIGPVLFFLAMVGLHFYQAKSLQSLARKFELICPSCARTFTLADLKLATTTQVCPFCGERVFS